MAPSQGRVALKLTQLWAYRELFYFLIWRDIKVRYKQTVLGAAWAIIQPLFTMIVFSIFFGRLAKIPSDGIPYPIFSYAALLPWTFFANGVAQSSNSLVGSTNLITKIYFPRIIIPLARICAGLLDFGLAFLVLIGLMIFYQVDLTMTLLWGFGFLLLALVTAVGAGLWLSAMNVYYRDIRYVIPFLTQFWLFATPIAYPSSLLSEPWRTLYGLNPMTGVVEGFRWALLGNSPPPLMIFLSVCVSLLLLITGMYYFRSVEKNFADVI